MALRLTIISQQSTALGEAASMLVDKEGARIGRASDNEWVLPDPNRYISAHHARITFKNGTYIVEDTSTNGLYLNDELEPVGRLGPQPLRAGDTLRMGPYQIRVRDSESTAVDASAIVPYGAPVPAEGPSQRDIEVDLNISSLLVADEDQSAVRRGYDPWGNPITDPGLQEFDSEQAAATTPRASPPRVAPATRETCRLVPVCSRPFAAAPESISKNCRPMVRNACFSSQASCCANPWWASRPWREPSAKSDRIRG